MNLIIESLQDPAPDERAVEVVERKGIGHPDTICDALAEEVSRALSRHYVERFGRVLHHNVDKALLCGGSSSPQFGGGNVTAPIQITLAGRVTTSLGGVEVVPAEELAIEACRAWLRAHLRALDPDRDVRIECRFRPGSEDLQQLFARASATMPLSNDTSIGVGFAPLSRLERAVRELERWLGAPETKRDAPETGEDVKIMAVRVGSSARLTVSCAFVSRHVASVADYFEKKSRLAASLAERATGLLGQDVLVEVNAGDDLARASVYLTVTGTSAEAGDDGEVGRGNRANGLITPCRPMSMEAVAGKNAVSHVGKLYNVAAGLIAADLAAKLGVSTECMLVSRIGAPIDEPALVSVRLRDERDAAEAVLRTAVSSVVQRRLGLLPELSRALVRGEIDVF
jgi:S-adenosylmethionine synthetase